MSLAHKVGRLAVPSSHYEADRAFDHFKLSDPKNRLVAHTLEARLNEKLATLQDAKTKLASGDQSNGPGLTEAQRRSLHALAQSLPQVWNHPSADPGLKKRLPRGTPQNQPVAVTSKPASRGSRTSAV